MIVIHAQNNPSTAIASPFSKPKNELPTIMAVKGVIATPVVKAEAPTSYSFSPKIFVTNRNPPNKAIGGITAVTIIWKFTRSNTP